uniref:Uncharacterized protein n=1 Tax=Glossina palpalis gambiensis TaxID=67801 RepID=A0A1B0AYG7_9MUSC
MQKAKPGLHALILRTPNVFNESFSTLFLLLFGKSSIPSVVANIFLSKCQIALLCMIFRQTSSNLTVTVTIIIISSNFSYLCIGLWNIMRDFVYATVKVNFDRERWEPHYQCLASSLTSISIFQIKVDSLSSTLCCVQQQTAVDIG